jgi:hypothetical protein
MATPIDGERQSTDGDRDAIDVSRMVTRGRVSAECQWGRGGACGDVAGSPRDTRDAAVAIRRLSVAGRAGGRSSMPPSRRLALFLRTERDRSAGGREGAASDDGRQVSDRRAGGHDAERRRARLPPVRVSVLAAPLPSRALPVLRPVQEEETRGPARLEELEPRRAGRIEGLSNPLDSRVARGIYWGTWGGSTASTNTLRMGGTGWTLHRTCTASPAAG